MVDDGPLCLVGVLCVSFEVLHKLLAGLFVSVLLFVVHYHCLFEYSLWRAGNRARQLAKIGEPWVVFQDLSYCHSLSAVHLQALSNCGLQFRAKCARHWKVAFAYISLKLSYSYTNRFFLACAYTLIMHIHLL